MLRAEDQIKKMAALTGAMLMATAEAIAQDKPSVLDQSLDKTLALDQASAPAKAMRPTRRIVVSITDRKLAVLESGRVVKIFPTAVGAPQSPSPTGVYKIVTSIPDPTWYYRGKVVGPGKSNPLGTRWLGLSIKGYGIHGTNVPTSIGHNASHGCVRMRNHDVEELFAMVGVGDQVELYTDRTPELDRILATRQLRLRCSKPEERLS